MSKGDKKSTADKLSEFADKLDNASDKAGKLGSKAMGAGCGLIILIIAIIWLFGGC